MKYKRPARKPRAKSRPPSEMVIPKLFVDRLETLRPGLLREDDRVRRGATRLAYRARVGGKPHAPDPEFIVLHHSFVDREIGRAREDGTGLARLRDANERLQLFDFITSDRRTAVGVAGGYRLRPDVQAALDSLADADPDPPPTSMLVLDSRETTRRRKPPKPLSSLTSSGAKCAAKWPAAHSGKTPVDRDSLRALREMARVAAESGVLPDGARIDDRQRAFCRRVARSARVILEVSNTDMAMLGPGVMHHRYRQHEYGRFYTVPGASLQLVPRIVRDAALHGCWDYDVRNCHPALAAQIADSLGLQLKHLALYVRDTEEELKRLMRLCGSSRRVVKGALLAVINGASTSRGAVARVLGVDRAAVFAADTLVVGLVEDCRLLRKTIVREWSERHGPRLRNYAGLLHEIDDELEDPPTKPLTKSQSIARDRERDKQRRRAFAFILQGAESAVLSAVIERHAGDLVLLQHDGFVARCRLSPDSLTAVAEAATGFRGLQFKEAEITPSEDEFCKSVRESGERAQASELAIETAREVGSDDHDGEG